MCQETVEETRELQSCAGGTDLQPVLDGVVGALVSTRTSFGLEWMSPDFPMAKQVVSMDPHAREVMVSQSKSVVVRESSQQGHEETCVKVQF